MSISQQKNRQLTHLHYSPAPGGTLQISLVSDSNNTGLDIGFEGKKPVSAAAFNFKPAAYNKLENVSKKLWLMQF